MNTNEYRDWNIGTIEVIRSIDYYIKHCRKRKYIALTSGGYDPIHPGHISVISDAMKVIWSKHQRNVRLSYDLVIIVNGDEFLKRKKGQAFMPLKTRCQIVSQIKGVNTVIPFNPSDSEDMTVCEAIRKIKPDFFLKGGDRTGIENIPEWTACKDVGCEILTNVGQPKYWSSSDFLAEWTSRWIEDNLPG